MELARWDNYDRAIPIVAALYHGIERHRMRRSYPTPAANTIDAAVA